MKLEFIQHTKIGSMNEKTPVKINKSTCIETKMLQLKYKIREKDS
jgi:hypothetical protein